MSICLIVMLKRLIKIEAGHMQLNLSIEECMHIALKNIDAEAIICI